MDPRKTESGADLASAAECDLKNGRLTFRLDADLSENAYDDLLARFATYLLADVSTLLIDKQGYKRSCASIDVAKSFGKKFGELLAVNKIRAAIVIDPKDFYETAMCVYAMETGAKIFTTDSRAEATMWLDGAIA